MLSTAELERALGAAGLAAPVRWDEVTGSTNETALAMAEGGAPEWTLVAAGHQTRGRGRLGRTWVDRPGRALLFSVILRPSGLAPGRAGLLPLAAGAAMAAAAREVTGADVGCKWPNDLLVDERKVGGILAESSVVQGAIRHVVVGIGVNIEAPDNVPDAGGLEGADPASLLTGFLRRFADLYDPSSQSFPAAVIRAYTEVSATLGREVEATRVDGERVRGRARGMDDTGALIVGTDRGVETVAFGEVAHLIP